MKVSKRDLWSDARKEREARQQIDRAVCARRNRERHESESKRQRQIMAAAIERKRRGK